MTLCNSAEMSPQLLVPQHLSWKHQQITGLPPQEVPHNLNTMHCLIHNVALIINSVVATEGNSTLILRLKSVFNILGQRHKQQHQSKEK